MYCKSNLLLKSPNNLKRIAEQSHFHSCEIEKFVLTPVAQLFGNLRIFYGKQDSSPTRQFTDATL